MSTIASILLGFALVLAVLAPLAVAYWKPGARLPVAGLYGVLLTGLAVHHTGLSFARVSAPPALAANDQGPLPETAEVVRQCGEALQVAQNASIIRDRTDYPRVVVDRSLWNQAPDLVKEGLVRCLQIARPEGEPAGDIEIVEQ